MNYNYLAQWVKEAVVSNLYFDSLKKIEDQYIIYFKKMDKYLQINLASEDNFLFFSDNPGFPYDELDEISGFSQTLRQAKLERIKIHTEDRIFILDFVKVDIYNQVNHFQLIVELISHGQNIILVRKDKDKLLILDCLKKISFAENNDRQILPGGEYLFPKALYQIQDNPIVYPLSFDAKGKVVEATEGGFKELNALFESLYYDYILLNKLEKQKKIQIAKYKKDIDKKSLKISKQNEELAQAVDEQKWFTYAELLKANYNMLNSGMENIEVTDYFSENFPLIQIPMLKEKGAKENIEFYYKKYRKAKTGKEKIKEQIEITNAEIESLESEIVSVELLDNYWEYKELFTKSKDQKNKNHKADKFKKISINADWEIYLGRTSTENDNLTCRVAGKNDWWFHTRVFRGTHVILRNIHKKNIPDQLITVCCSLAAYFSKAKSSSNVPVDYTQIKYVRKPKSSPPGYVIYTNQKTIFSEPMSFRDAVALVQKLVSNGEI